MQQPPITRYRDEIPADETQNIVNGEIEREMKDRTSSETLATTPTKLKVLPVEQQGRSERKLASNASNIVNAFRQKMASTGLPIDLPSVGKTVEFKEISTAEQKDISKIAMESDSRADIMYVAMVGLINRLSMEKGFDIRDYTEFERIAITLNLQQMNKINPEIKFVCPKCGKENSYNLDTPRMLKNFSKTYRPDEVVEIDSGNRKFEFTIGWPKVSIIEDFFKSYYKKYDGARKNVKDSIDNLAQVEYTIMFVKKVRLTDMSEPDDSMVADLEQMTYGERVQLIDCLPQNLLFDEKTGVIAKIISNFVDPMNKVFKYRDCAFCGAEQNGQIANLTDFLG